MFNIKCILICIESMIPGNYRNINDTIIWFFDWLSFSDHQIKISVFQAPRSNLSFLRASFNWKTLRLDLKAIPSTYCTEKMKRPMKIEDPLKPKGSLNGILWEYNLACHFMEVLQTCEVPASHLQVPVVHCFCFGGNSVKNSTRDLGWNTAKVIEKYPNWILEYDLE